MANVIEQSNFKSLIGFGDEGQFYRNVFLEFQKLSAIFML